MRQRGRSSSARLSVVPPDATTPRLLLTPFEPLKSAERKIFDLIVRENAHLRQTDVPLVMGYARASTGLLQVETAGDFDKLARVMMSLATKLRISPQSRLDPKTLARRIADQDNGPKPWERGDKE